MSTVRATHKKFLYKHKIHLLDLYKKSGIISASNKFGKDYIMKAKRIIPAITAAVLLCAAVFTAASCQKSSAKYTVGICQLVKHDALDAATKGFTDELKKQFGDEIEFIEQNAQGQTETCTFRRRQAERRAVRFSAHRSRSTERRSESVISPALSAETFPEPPILPPSISRRQW